MKSKALIKLMIVSLVFFGLIISSNNLVQGMNKANLVEKMAGEVGISRVSSNSLEIESSWVSLPSYNLLWPLRGSALSLKDLQTSLEIPLVNSFYGLKPCLTTNLLVQPRLTSTPNCVAVESDGILPPNLTGIDPIPPLGPIPPLSLD